MTDEQIRALCDEENTMENEPDSGVQERPDTDTEPAEPPPVVEETPSEEGDPNDHAVTVTSEGKVAEAPANFAGLITTDQDRLSDAARKCKIVMEGICTNCAHCGMPLRDPVSVQRGIGPICSKRGYLEEPDAAGDPVEAMLCLGEYPHLVNFLVENSEGLETGNVRNLLNYLVRICSLNRRTAVHDACTDAIETMGFQRLASMLRETLCVAEIKQSHGNPDFYAIWIKKSEWTRQWSYAWRGQFPQSTFSKVDKGMRFKKTDRRRVWNLLISHYEGLCIKTPEGKAVRIKKADPTPETAN